MGRPASEKQEKREDLRAVATGLAILSICFFCQFISDRNLDQAPKLVAYLVSTAEEAQQWKLNLLASLLIRTATIISSSGALPLQEKISTRASALETATRADDMELAKELAEANLKDILRYDKEEVASDPYGPIQSDRWKSSSLIAIYQYSIGKQDWQSAIAALKQLIELPHASAIDDPLWHLRLSQCYLYSGPQGVPAALGQAKVARELALRPLQTDNKLNFMAFAVVAIDRQLERIYRQTQQEYLAEEAKVEAQRYLTISNEALAATDSKFAWEPDDKKIWDKEAQNSQNWQNWQRNSY